MEIIILLLDELEGKMEKTDLKTGEKGAWISIASYIFLAIVKSTIGNIGNSEALSADGLNNLTDVFASIAVLVGIKISQKPADENHKYGHSRAETISSLIAALIMFSVGLKVVMDAFEIFFFPVDNEPELFTAYVGLFSAIFMYFVYRYNLKLSRKIGSKALYSAAQDSKSDALVSVGAIVGIVGSYFGLKWLDPLTAAIVGLIICLTAWKIFKDAVHDLTDGFEVRKLKEIENTINSTPGVKFVKDIKARLHGNKPIVDAIIFVEPSITVFQGHKITDEVEKRLSEKHNITDAHIHIDPY